MKVAVVGCGNISNFHISSIISNPLSELVAVCDMNQEQAEKKAQEFGVQKSYTDVDEMFKQEQLDVVHVLTPPKTHAPISIKALEKGIHVFVEKPLATKVSEAEEMIKVAQQNNVRVCVNHNMVFEPVVNQAYEVVNSFDFGDLLHIESYYAFDTSRLADPNNADDEKRLSWLKDLQGNVIQDLFPHPMSIILRFMRDYNKSFHILKSSMNGTLFSDELKVFLDSERTTGTMTISLATNPDIFIMTFYGTKMILRMDLANLILVKQKTYNIPKMFARGLDSISQSSQIFFNTITTAMKIVLKRIQTEAGIGILIDQFYKSIQDDWMSPVSYDHAKKVVKLSEEIWN